MTSISRVSIHEILPAVPVVEQQRPGVLLRLDLVGAVQRRDEAPVLGDEVLLAVDLAAPSPAWGSAGEVRDQRGIPRLHHAEVDVVLEPVGAGVHDVVLVPDATFV